MARRLERFNDYEIRETRTGDSILRVLSDARSDFYAQTGRYPQTFILTTTAYNDLTSKFPGSQRGVEHIFFGMRMMKNDDAGLTDDEFEVTD